ncbi:MAG: mercury methylation corrinoid protein HgcA [Coriobacteriia bacterium]|nr:mercury methylation corrinoid protein HgcA [Coriobacteriia bacterium]
MEEVPQLSSQLTWRDTLKRWSLRWGVGRENSAVAPGLYRVGIPTSSSSVIVTCNYRMTVDLVRRDLDGVDAWLLVLETYGINVWCAAGKKTFGTDELVRRIFATHLADYVDHETLILPQLGAVGVAAHKVRQLTGYRVVWGPVRSADLKAFLDAGNKTTPDMRAVTFTLRERMALAPMEIMPSLHYALYAIPALLVLAVLGASIAMRAFAPLAALMGLFPSLMVFVLAVFAGAVMVPALLPWLPGRAFTVKGAVAGAVLALLALVTLPGMLGGQNVLGWAAVLLAVSSAASYLGVNFTGSTPYTSPSGVEAELRRAIPLEVAGIVVALVCWTAAWTTMIARIR